jgi:RNA polymerase sigma-70 factor (ECF subfamily)
MNTDPPEHQPTSYDFTLTELTRRLLGGDSQVLGDVLRLLGPRIERTIRSRLGNALADADYDDILSIALFRLWQRRPRFDPSQARLDRWFYVLARNAALDLLRHRKRRQEESLGDNADAIPARDLTTTGTRHEQLRVDLSRALEQVSDTDKRILFSGLPEAELSRELGLRPGTIRVRRLRTKLKLKVSLRKMGHVIEE